MFINPAVNYPLIYASEERKSALRRVEMELEEADEMAGLLAQVKICTEP